MAAGFVLEVSLTSKSDLSKNAMKTKKNEKTTPQPNRNVGGEKKNHATIPERIGSCARVIVFHGKGWPTSLFSTTRTLAITQSPIIK